MGLRESVLSAAVVTFMLLALLVPAAAPAALSDREGDPVVTMGAEVPALLGTAPGRIVGFAWKGGWRQVPVQVDERKEIDVRTLYPNPGPPYVALLNMGFPLEVYADAKTRTGADPDPRFDADDELTFMARDAGARVRPGGVARPSGTLLGGSAVVTVTDPIDGGTAWLYLFRSSGKLGPSAGRSYVDYDFRLLNLAPGQSIADGYQYVNSNNPEDSTVTTDYYSAHSTDRWMDDEIRIRTGGATGVDILDREVAQATLTGCGRTELTFSGNWNRGSDTDEGTFVAVKSGPVRAIRDYMGANSGPYTQRQHIYYEQREDNTVFLRVHPMLDLYAWTDYSAEAVGMTYRNLKNPGGVTVDGQPDDLVQATDEDFAAGKVAWEQLVGPQGAVNTVTSAETDIEVPRFGSYYLDDDNLPLNGNRRQCSGDGVSYGASGFGIGIGGTTPNTDPRLGIPENPAKVLNVKRVRYFAGPDSDAAEAARRSEQVTSPLAVSSSRFTPKTTPRLRVVTAPRMVRVRPGRPFTVRVRVRNTGEAVARGVRVCLRTPRGIAGAGCRTVGSLPPGRAAVVPMRLRAGKYSGRKDLRISGVATARGLKPAGSAAVVRVR
jgi:hypothetical protein